MDGLIFDVDGTIWNSTGIVAEAWNAAIKEAGADADEVTAEILKGQFGKMMNVIGDNLFPRVPAGKERENLLHLCEAKEEKALAENEKLIISIAYKISYVFCYSCLFHHKLNVPALTVTNYKQLKPRNF